MASTAETYREAANEHLARARELYAEEKFFLGHYIAGLAVESHLRAYLRRHTDDFDPRHDIERLAQASNFYDIVPRNETQKFASVFALVNQRWRANHRYFSERQFLDYMNEIKAEFNQKGNRWKNLTRTMLEASLEVIKQGEAKWDS